jgi:hypothetical protein
MVAVLALKVRDHEDMIVSEFTNTNKQTRTTRHTVLALGTAHPCPRSHLMAVAAFKPTTATPAVKEIGSPQGTGLREHTRAAQMPFGLAAGAAAKLALDSETHGFHACLAVEVPQIVHREMRQRHPRVLRPFRRECRH